MGLELSAAIQILKDADQAEVRAAANVVEQAFRRIRTATGKTLSYSQRLFVQEMYRILMEKPGDPIPVSRVAESLGVNKGIATVGLKKLVAAGIIDAQSLGSKGMRVEVLDLEALEEVVESGS